MAEEGLYAPGLTTAGLPLQRNIYTTAPVAPAPTSSNSICCWLLAILVALVVIALVAWWIWMRKKEGKPWY